MEEGQTDDSDTESGWCTPPEYRTDSDGGTSSGMEGAENMAVYEESADEFSDGTDEDEGDGIRDMSQLGAGVVAVKVQTVHQQSYQLINKDTKSLAQHIVGCCQQQQGEVSAAPQQQQQLQRGSGGDGDERTDQAHLSTSTTCVVPETTSLQVPGTSALTPAPTSSLLPRVPGSLVSQIQSSGLLPVPVSGNSPAVTQYNLIQVRQQFGDVTVKGGKNLNIGGTQNVSTAPTKQEEEEIPLTAAQKIRKRTTSRIQLWTKDMVETDALKKVKEKLHRGATWVTITGRPGEGKSTTAYMALKDLHSQGRQVYQVVSPEEFNEVIMACSHPVILLDDITKQPKFVIEKCSLSFINQRLRLAPPRGREENVAGSLAPDYVSSRNQRRSVFVNQILSLDPDLNARDGFGKSVFHYLCVNGLTLAVKNVLDKGVDVNEDQGSRREHPLYIAIEKGHVEVVKLLVNRGCYVDNQKGLRCAVVSLNVDMVLFFLNRRVKVDGTVVCIACEAGELNIVEMLFEKGATVNMVSYGEDTPLHSACEGNPTVVAYLLKKGASVNQASNRTGDTPLHKAAGCGSTKCADVLLKAGADVNVQNITGDTALHKAAGGESTECVDVLLKAGADVNVQNNTGDTALHKAAGGESTECVDVLLKAGADVNVQNNTGDTPLHEAAGEGSTESVDVLLKAGADVNVQNNTGDTPLHEAAGEGSTECVDVLLKAGADVNVQNNTGDTPLHIAAGRGSTESVDVLLKAGADVNVQNNTGDTPLHEAAGEGST
ncbi:putative ankyrin repeat protein RF_0381, partial [Haliotis rubra]|uniref:putative ankyrin repeat protein RF_0381 n=1 Tax=Haliotis rubra TaxID=36100 RepID=UPI001EE622B6